MGADRAYLERVTLLTQAALMGAENRGSKLKRRLIVFVQMNLELPWCYWKQQKLLSDMILVHHVSLHVSRLNLEWELCLSFDRNMADFVAPLIRDGISPFLYVDPEMHGDVRTMGFILKCGLGSCASGVTIYARARPATLGSRKPWPTASTVFFSIYHASPDKTWLACRVPCPAALLSFPPFRGSRKTWSQLECSRLLFVISS